MPILDLDDRVTGDEQRFEFNRKSDKSLILLSPPEAREAHSVELSLGDRWSETYGVGDSTMYQIPAEGIRIGRHDSVVVEVRETIAVPDNAYGIIVPTGSLFLHRGLIIGAGKIEPNFRGYLKLRLFNTTRKAIVLAPGNKLASAIFLETEGTRDHNLANPRETVLVKAVPFKVKAGRWLQVNWPIVIGWTISAAAGAGAMAAAIIAYLQMQGQ